jgi:predicted nucleotide-binding protein
MSTPAPTTAPSPAPVPTPQGAAGARVAIVCRLGEAAREAASGFVAKLGLEPVVLRDMDAGEGTFVERLDGLRDLDFAIILLSADDLGAPAVLLEIGFLLGACGRGRVCFILEGAPALVPDLNGVARHTMDDGGLWRLLLAREMKQSGLDVDLNRAL